MQHMDLWFDLAMKGEPNLEEEALARFQLKDGAEPDLGPDARGHEDPAPPDELL